MSVQSVTEQPFLPFLEPYFPRDLSRIVTTHLEREGDLRALSEAPSENIIEMIYKRSIVFLTQVLNPINPDLMRSYQPINGSASQCLAHINAFLVSLLHKLDESFHHKLLLDCCYEGSDEKCKALLESTRFNYRSLTLALVLAIENGYEDFARSIIQLCKTCRSEHETVWARFVLEFKRDSYKDKKDNYKEMVILLRFTAIHLGEGLTRICLQKHGLYIQVKDLEAIARDCGMPVRLLIDPYLD